MTTLSCKDWEGSESHGELRQECNVEIRTLQGTDHIALPIVVENRTHRKGKWTAHLKFPDGYTSKTGFKTARAAMKAIRKTQEWWFNYYAKRGGQ
jgi:hypothetical protein